MGWKEEKIKIENLKIFPQEIDNFTNFSQEKGIFFRKISYEKKVF